MPCFNLTSDCLSSGSFYHAKANLLFQASTETDQRSSGQLVKLLKFLLFYMTLISNVGVAVLPTSSLQSHNCVGGGGGAVWGFRCTICMTDIWYYIWYLGNGSGWLWLSTRRKLNATLFFITSKRSRLLNTTITL